VGRPRNGGPISPRKQASAIRPARHVDFVTDDVARPYLPGPLSASSYRQPPTRPRLQAAPAAVGMPALGPTPALWLACRYPEIARLNRHHLVAGNQAGVHPVPRLRPADNCRLSLTPCVADAAIRAGYQRKSKRVILDHHLARRGRAGKSCRSFPSSRPLVGPAVR